MGVGEQVRAQVMPGGHLRSMPIERLPLTTSNKCEAVRDTVEQRGYTPFGIGHGLAIVIDSLLGRNWV